MFSKVKLQANCLLCSSRLSKRVGALITSSCQVLMVAATSLFHLSSRSSNASVESLIALIVLQIELIVVMCWCSVFLFFLLLVVLCG
nr:hypothetical protein [Cressdnaviricota sp.]